MSKKLKPKAHAKASEVKKWLTTRQNLPTRLPAKKNGMLQAIKGPSLSQRKAGLGLTIGCDNAGFGSF
jgi:hypothetical protein